MSTETQHTTIYDVGEADFQHALLEVCLADVVDGCVLCLSAH